MTSSPNFLCRFNEVKTREEIEEILQKKLCRRNIKKSN